MEGMSMTRKPSATFVFPSPIAPRAWSRAKQRLETQGVVLTVVDQTTPVNWDEFAAQSVQTADVLYLGMTQQFSGFDALLDAATAVPLVLPGSREVEAEWPDVDRTAGKAVAACLKSGRAEDLADGILWLLHRAGTWRRSPPAVGLA
jgi:hypothetical protein